MADTDPASAHLDFIRQLAEQALYRPETLDLAVALPVLVGHTVRLLDAVEGVLELAAEWDTKAAALWSQIEMRDLDGAVGGFKAIGAEGYRHRARDVRDTVSRGLTEGGSDG